MGGSRGGHHWDRGGHLCKREDIHQIIRATNSDNMLMEEERKRLSRGGERVDTWLDNGLRIDETRCRGDKKPGTRNQQGQGRADDLISHFLQLE